MSRGQLYILSNPSLSSDVFKIGLTRKTPAERMNELNRSSAIPANFKLEYETPVENVKTAERRVHLLLDPERVNPAKEFFKINLPRAIETCKAIAAYEQEDDTISDQIELSSQILGARYLPGPALMTKKLIYLLIGATTNNTLFDRIFKVQRGVADGFLTAAQVSAHFKIGTKTASQAMRRLALNGTMMSCHLLDEPPMESIFDFIRYHKGHVAWRFSDEFRNHFKNPKI